MPPACPSPGDLRALVLATLQRPEQAAILTPGQWSLVVPLARQSGLLARLCVALETAGMLERIPEAPRRHLEAARLVADHHRHDLLIELRRIADTLEPLGVPVVLLKGAAYAAAGLPPARGRTFSDIDLMVPRTALEQAESALMLAGWVAAKTDPYDRAYYRRWMHQLPPMRHLRRLTVIDVHHAIAPPTARHRVDPAPIFAASTPLADLKMRIPAPEDLILHSASHLFNEGVFTHALRDLWDIDLLLRHFSQESEFRHRLAERARLLGLTDPLARALFHARQLFDADASPSIPWRNRSVMALLFDRALLPAHGLCRTWPTSLALGALYLRGHWLRMPLRLLLPHLARKGWLEVRQGVRAEPHMPHRTRTQCADDLR